MIRYRFPSVTLKYKYRRWKEHRELKFQILLELTQNFVTIRHQLDQARFLSIILLEKERVLCRKAGNWRDITRRAGQTAGDQVSSLYKGRSDFFPSLQASLPANENRIERKRAAHTTWSIPHREFTRITRIADPGSGGFLTPGSGIRDG